MKRHFLVTLTAYCLASISAVYADQLYVLNNGSNNISVIDTLSNTEISSISVGNQPSAIAFAPATKILYVANRTDNTVDAIDTTTNQKISSPIHVGSHPIGLFISPNEKQVYVLTEGATSISVIDTGTYNISATIPIGAEPFFAAMARQSKKLYVICYASHVINVIDTTTSALIDVISIGPVGTNPSGIAIFSPPDNPTDEVVYVTVPDPQSNYSDGRFIAINATSHKIVASIPVERVPSSVTIAPNGKQAFVINGVYSHNIHIIDTKTYGVRPIPVGTRSAFGVFSPNDRLYITNAASNNVTAIDTQTYEVINTIPVGFWPLGGTIDSHGMLYICNSSGNTVSVINTNDNTVITTIPVRTNPTVIVP